MTSGATIGKIKAVPYRRRSSTCTIATINRRSKRARIL
jgi:hypothetical protein